MILVILALCIGLIALGAIMENNICTSWDIPCAIIGVIGAIISLITILILCITVTEMSMVDEKISMYQEENTKIEQQIAIIVNEYKSYETDTFENVKPDDAMTYVTLYPELKSDTLVQKQIEVHMSNNDKIKELKEQQIMGGVYRWWLYFGR